MKTKSYRLTDKLNSWFKEKVEKWIAEVNKDSEVIFLTETWRSVERQRELVKLWLSKVKRSNHQDWLAVDVWFRPPSELYPKDDNMWRKVADIAKKYQIDWWYDLWKWDKPHFQDNWIPLKNIPMKSKYSDIMIQELKESNLSPIFSSHEWDKPLTERETKELIEIALIRNLKR
jgi:hypothetical protein